MSNLKANIEPGAKFNRWTLIERVYDEHKKLVGWRCECDCGTIQVVPNIGTVSNGRSKSCGCLRREGLKKNNPMFNKVTRDKVSASIKADPNRKNIIAKAVEASQTDEVKLKRSKTNMDRYGGASPACSTEVMNKIKESNLDKYGSVSPAGNTVIRRKMSDTCMAKYGVDNIMKLPEYRKLVSDLVSEYRRDKGLQQLSDGQNLVDVCRLNGKLATSARNVARKYGMDVAESWIKHSTGAMSALELKLMDLLNNGGLDASIYNRFVSEVEAIGGRYKPDLLVKGSNKNIYVDADGLYYHSKRENKYHYDKLDFYKKANVRLFQFREDEILYKSSIVISMVKSAMGMSKRIGARLLTIKPLSQKETDIFMAANHLMGAGASSKNIALFDSDRVLTVLSYKKHKDGIDISRVATACGYSVAGGISRLLAEVIRLEQPRFIQSFVDRRYATGQSLEILGFKLVGVTLGWQWTDGKITFNRQQCVANMDDRKLSEAQHAIELGWDKIYDAGQAKYVKYLGEI